MFSKWVPSIRSKFKDMVDRNSLKELSEEGLDHDASKGNNELLRRFLEKNGKHLIGQITAIWGVIIEAPTSNKFEKNEGFKPIEV